MTDIDWFRICWTGLVAGAVINLIDVPNSIWLTGPALQRDLAARGAKPHPLMPPFFVAIHFVLGAFITLGYAVGVRAGTGDFGVALIAVLIPVVINRLFGYGFVLLRVFSGPVFLGLSASLFLGGTLGGLFGCYLYRPW